MPVQTQLKREDATRNIMQKSGHSWSNIFRYKEKTISEHTQCSIHKALLTHLAVPVPRTRFYQRFTIIITHMRNYMHNITQFWHVLSIFFLIFWETGRLKEESVLGMKHDSFTSKASVCSIFCSDMYLTSWFWWIQLCIEALM
jgi:hypothetical protein